MKNKYLELFKELDELKKYCYVPYSKFRVSSIIYLKNGKKINGVNIENGAYPATICGERSALSSMYSQGYGKYDVDFMTLSTDSYGIGTPCGICRQVLVELLFNKTKLLIFNKKTFVKEITVDQLLPLAFTKELLNS